MKRKQKSEKQKEADSKGKERMKRFEENQKAPKKKKEEPVPESDMACVEYCEKSVINGDQDWHRRMYFYNKKDKKEKFS